MKRVLFFIMTFTVILSLLNTAVFSYELPDLDRLGSIGVTMRYGGKSVPGGSMTLYRIGDITADNGNCSFVLSGDFASVEASLEDLESAQLIYTVAAYIAEHDIMGSTMPIDNDGMVKFYDLEPGLYMLIQTVAANGYNCANPFIVSLPMFTDGGYVYEVDASAKAELTKNNDNPHEDTTPDSGDTSGPKDTDSNGGKLPQTGQLKWPIPILTVAGAGLVLVGLILCFGGRRTENEN